MSTTAVVATSTTTLMQKQQLLERLIQSNVLDSREASIQSDDRVRIRAAPSSCSCCCCVDTDHSIQKVAAAAVANGALHSRHAGSSLEEAIQLSHLIHHHRHTATTTSSSSTPLDQHRGRLLSAADDVSVDAHLPLPGFPL